MILSILYLYIPYTSMSGIKGDDFNLILIDFMSIKFCNFSQIIKITNLILARISENKVASSDHM